MIAAPMRQNHNRPLIRQNEQKEKVTPCTIPQELNIVAFEFVGSVAGGSILSQANTISTIPQRGVMRMLHIQTKRNHQHTFVTANIAPGHGNH